MVLRPSCQTVSHQLSAPASRRSGHRLRRSAKCRRFPPFNRAECGFFSVGAGRVRRIVEVTVGQVRPSPRYTVLKEPITLAGFVCTGLSVCSAKVTHWGENHCPTQRGGLERLGCLRRLRDVHRLVFHGCSSASFTSVGCHEPC